MNGGGYLILEFKILKEIIFAKKIKKNCTFFAFLTKKLLSLQINCVYNS